MAFEQQVSEAVSGYDAELTKQGFSSEEIEAAKSEVFAYRGRDLAWLLCGQQQVGKCAYALLSLALADKQ